MRSPGLVAALLVGCLSLPSLAIAQNEQPVSLPPLHADMPLQVAGQQPAVRWQLHQQLDHSLQTGEGRLSFSPAVSVILHDPQSGPRLQQDQASAELQALERRSDAVRSALHVHLDWLRLQQQDRTGQLLSEWLSHWLELPVGTPAQAARAQLQRLEVEALLLDARDHAELLALRLESNGYGRDPARQQFRPLLELGADPLLKCLQSSPAIRRIEVLNQLELLSQEHNAAGRQLMVELELRASATLTQAASVQPGAALDFNAGLRISRADHSEPRLQLDISNHAITQSFTIRGPASEPAASGGGAPDFREAADNEFLRLMSLLVSLEQVRRQEDLARETLALELDLLHIMDLEAAPVRQDLSVLLQPLLMLQQAELRHDQLALELAAECGFPVTYTEVAGLP